MRRVLVAVQAAAAVAALAASGPPLGHSPVEDPHTPKKRDKLSGGSRASLSRLKRPKVRLR